MARIHVCAGAGASALFRPCATARTISGRLAAELSFTAHAAELDLPPAMSSCCRRCGTRVQRRSTLHSKRDPLGHTESMSAMLDSRGVRADLGDIDRWPSVYGVSPRTPALLGTLRLARFGRGVILPFWSAGEQKPFRASLGPCVHGKRTVWELSRKRRVPRLVTRTDSRKRCMPRAVSNVRDAHVWR
jgi:hypothetical protein